MLVEDPEGGARVCVRKIDVIYSFRWKQTEAPAADGGWIVTLHVPTRLLFVYVVPCKLWNTVC